MPFSLENSGYVKTQGIYINPRAKSDFTYSDGDQVENFLSESFQKSKDLSVGSEELQKYIYDWPSLYHLSPKRADLLRPFADQLKNKKVLEIGSGCGAVTRFLGELGCSALSLEGSLRRARITAERCRGLENVTVVNDNFEDFLCNEKFDFVILVGVLEYGNIFMATSDNGPLAMLTKAKEFLTTEGKLIIAIENKIGLKYWAGAPEDHIGHTYYSIQNLYSDKDIKTFGHYEITSLLKEAGFRISEFMYPFPDYKFADVIITDAGFKKQGFDSVELLLEKFDYFQNMGYDSKFSSNLAAYSLYSNQLLSHFANSFLIMATSSETSHLQKENPVLAFVYSTSRTRKYCKQTTFLSKPESEAVYVARQLLYESNSEDSPNLKHILEDEPYLNGRILIGTILPIVSANGWSTKDIITWSRTFYEVLISKSFDKDNYAWLEGKYLDLTPFNIVLGNGQPQFFDLEWISNEDLPAYYVFFRGLAHSLGRILFVNNPEQGTPLQIIQLATETTKYYFQFDDAELGDCKSREMKYFSAVAPRGMTEPFPMQELNVRNSDYLKLLDTKKELSSQNDRLANELNKNQEQFESEKIALLDAATKKQEKFDSEKLALLNEIRKRQEQFDKEKVALLDDATKKQEQFDNEKVALSDDATKKQEQFEREKVALSEEISYLKESITWYKDTYENRSILGVFKEKIISALKQKIKPDISRDNPSSKIWSGNVSLPAEDVISIEKQEEQMSALTSADELQKQKEAGQNSFSDSLNVKYQVDPPLLSDVCLFSSFSFSGKVEEYVFYYLAELKKVGFSTVFVSTSPLADSCVTRLSQYAFLIIERENTCPDFGSWKAGLSMLNWGGNLNSVLLANDSVFGPFFDLSSIIFSMKNKYDVWGMTDSYEIGYHLQSYFLYFNKVAIDSDVFTGFWKNVDLSASKDEVIHKYEIGLSSLLISSKFNIGAYASIDIISKDAVHGHKIVNPLLVFWKSLITANHFPFLKRELIIKRNISRTYDDHRDLYVNVGGWSRLIKENSSYPVTHIVEFMNSYCETIKAVNNSIVLQRRKILFLSDSAEIGEPQMVLLAFLQWLKKESDIDIEIIICKKGKDELTADFGKLGMVTNFYTVSQADKKNLKGRLIDDVALVVSNTFENLDVQKFLLFLDVPQIIFAHKPVSASDVVLLDNNREWVRNNVSHFIANSNLVKQSITEYFGVDDKKVTVVYKSDSVTASIETSKLLKVINKYYDYEELRFNQDPLVTFMTHIYYENSWDEIKSKLKNFDNGKNHFLFSISEACLVNEQIIEDIRESFRNAFSLVTSNIGKDIGGKMALIDLYLLLDIKSSYIVFLHDKQSPHSLGGESWKNKLFKIIDPNNQNQILDLFKDPKTGIVGAKDHIVNEHDDTTDTFRNNNQLSKKLLAQFNISIDNYDFLGGSIYWLRASIIESFFRKNNPILMREGLEAGNVLDLHGERLAHTWERMFSWIAANQGYRIEGI